MAVRIQGRFCFFELCCVLLLEPVASGGRPVSDRCCVPEIVVHDSMTAVAREEDLQQLQPRSLYGELNDNVDVCITSWVC